MLEDELLRRITPWDMCLLADAAEGLSYSQIAVKRQRKVKTIERAFERLREKLRPYGGGTKAGMVHWYDTHYETWREWWDQETGRGA